MKFVFAKCIVCESFKLGKNNNDAIEYEVKLRNHILHQELCRNLYHIWRTKLVRSKNEFLCIIHDKMDHAKIVLLRFQMCNKMIFGLGQLPVVPIGLVAHGHMDEIFT